MNWLCKPKEENFFAQTDCAPLSTLIWRGVHHRTYERRGDENLNDLTTLCQPCHERFHKEKDPDLQAISVEIVRGNSFKSFNPHISGVQEAYQECVEYGRDPDGWLLLVGPSGCGKSHLAMAIARQCKERGVGVLIYSVPDLLDFLRSTPDYYKAFSQIKETEVLVLDDLGVQQGSPWVSEKLFQLFNYRYNLQMPTVIVSNPKELQGIDERIRSRLSDNSLVTSITFNHVRDYRPNHPQRDSNQPSSDNTKIAKPEYKRHTNRSNNHE